MYRQVPSLKETQRVCVSVCVERERKKGERDGEIEKKIKIKEEYMCVREKET